MIAVVARTIDNIHFKVRGVPLFVNSIKPRCYEARDKSVGASSLYAFFRVFNGSHVRNFRKVIADIAGVEPEVFDVDVIFAGDLGDSQISITIL